MNEKKLYIIEELHELARDKYRGKYINYYRAHYGKNKDNKRIKLYEIQSIKEEITPLTVCMYYHRWAPKRTGTRQKWKKRVTTIKKGSKKWQEKRI